MRIPAAVILRCAAIAALCVLPVSRAAAEKPLLALFGVSSDSPRTRMMGRVLSRNLESVSAMSGVFERVNSDSVIAQLQRFGCVDERCYIPFAARAKIAVVVRGGIAERDEGIAVSLIAYGTDVPFNGKIIYHYAAEIPLRDGTGAEALNSIFREHGLRFFSGLLARYRAPVSLGDLRKGAHAGTGRYPLFRRSDLMAAGVTPLDEAGQVDVAGGAVHGISMRRGEADDGDIALVSYGDRAESLRNQAYEEKREVLLEGGRPLAVAYALILTIPMSALSPLLAPTVGYFMNSDWQGLLLWSVNAPPYLYLEIDGLVHMPFLYRRDRRDIPREVHTRFRFAVYMIAAGGLPLFADAAARIYLRQASDYQGPQPFIGNPWIAAYLSLVAGGAGHFYRGHRFWGYLYYHLNNLLVYFTLREFSPSERYNPLTDSYFKSRINRTRAYTLLGACALVKVIEVAHVLLQRDTILNGDVREQDFAVEPVLLPDREDTALGLRFSLRY